MVPDDYREFLERNGAFEGELVEEGSTIILWSIAELAQANADIQIAELAPGFVAFAGDGGGEVFAFDSTGAVFMLPLIGMEPKYAIPIANSFLELAARIVRAA